MTDKPANATEALRECPFCGEIPTSYHDHVGLWYGHANLTGPCFASVCQIMPVEIESWNRRAVLAEPPKDGETNKDAGSGVRAIGPTQQGITAGGCPVQSGLANPEVGSQSDPASPFSAPPKEVAALLADAEIPSTKTLSEQLRGFAAYCESVGRGEGFDKDDCTMFAKKFREAADALARLSAPVPRQDFNEVVQQARENVRPLIEAKRGPIDTGVIYDNDGKSADRGQQSVQRSGEGGGGVSAVPGRKVGEDHQADGVRDADDPRRADGDGKGNRRFFDMTREEQERWIDKCPDDPPSCPHGVMAGVCPSCVAAPVPAREWMPERLSLLEDAIAETLKRYAGTPCATFLAGATVPFGKPTEQDIEWAKSRE